MGTRALPSRTERTIVATRVLLAAASLFAVWLDPSQPAKYVAATYALHALYVGYSIILALWAWNRGSTAALAVVTHVFDIIAFSIFQFLTLGPSSPFFMYFVFSLFCGALRWGRRGTVATALVVIPAFLLLGLWMSRTLTPDQFELNRFVIRTVYLLVMAVLLIYLGQHEDRLRQEIERLAHWPPPGGTPSEALTSVLQHAVSVVNAADAIVMWEMEDEPWTHVASWTGGRLSTARYAPDEFQMPQPQGEPTSASARFETDHTSGRVLFTGLQAPTSELVALTGVVARELGSSIEQIAVAGHLREAALGEQRLAVARDLHDGVLQSLTALRFELQNLASEVHPDAIGQRLHAVERALGIEQRELRLFIEQLKPRPAAEADVPLVRDLDRLRERIALEWKTPVTIRVAAPIGVLPPALERAVPPMVHEAVVNAIKHSGPSRVWVDVESDKSTLRIVVGDDGRGFPFKGRFDQATLTARRMGPVSLCERTASLGGQLTIESEGTGSRVEIALPLAGAA